MDSVPSHHWCGAIFGDLIISAMVTIALPQSLYPLYCLWFTMDSSPPCLLCWGYQPGCLPWQQQHHHSPPLTLRSFQAAHGLLWTVSSPPCSRFHYPSLFPKYLQEHLLLSLLGLYWTKFGLCHPLPQSPGSIFLTLTIHGLLQAVSSHLLMIYIPLVVFPRCQCGIIIGGLLSAMLIVALSHSPVSNTGVSSLQDSFLPCCL